LMFPFLWHSRECRNIIAAKTLIYELLALALFPYIKKKS
jgi:hypothetical protein